MHIGQSDNDKLVLGGCDNGSLANARIDCYGVQPAKRATSQSVARDKRGNHNKTMLEHLTTMLSQMAQRGI